MQFSVLSSGSKANATVALGSRAALLIDCGLSCRELEARLKLVGISPTEICGILITHEHYDHVRGLERFSRVHKIPTYCTRATKRALSAYHFEVIEAGGAFAIDEFTVRSVPICHDAVDPVGFSVTSGGETLSCITDLGVVTPAVRDALRRSHAVVFESNHDVDLLGACAYPETLKERIRSAVGHLSNETAAQTLREELHPELTRVVLGHLSENSNTPATALRAMGEELREHFGARLTTASVREATPLFAVAASDFASPSPGAGLLCP